MQVGYLISMENNKSNYYFLMSSKQWHKLRSVLKVLKVAHVNLLEWFEMSYIGIYGVLFGITWFSGIWKHKQKYRLVHAKASNRLGSDNSREQ